MIDFLLVIFVKALLWLRYRVRVQGIDEVLRQGGGILFLPNHPALIDPIIVLAHLFGRFKVRAWADRDRIDIFLIRHLAQRLGVLPLPDIGKGGLSSASEVRRVIDESIKILQQGENLLIYPAGRIYRQYLEDLRGNSAVERVLNRLPEVRVVLVRTRGMWGSSFGWASGREPQIDKILRKGIFSLLKNGIFFGPRREVTIELVEPADLPRNAERSTINKYLEDFYNEEAWANTYVPYTIWEGGGIRQLPEPISPGMAGEIGKIPANTRQIVYQYLQELTGVKDFTDDASLALDLGMDSLSKADMLLWLQKEFGFTQGDIDSIQKVSDVMLAACGEAVSSAPTSLKPVPKRWFDSGVRCNRPAGFNRKTITEAFLVQAQKEPDEVIVADQISGVKTYRDLILGIMVLKPEIEKLPGQYLGIMMPASVGVNVVYLATLFAGKTPVMINWTLGRKNLAHCLELMGIERIVTARAVVSRIKIQGIDLTDFQDRFVCLEDIRQQLTTVTKLGAWLKSHVSWSSLRRVEVSDTAVLLFTSGSENLPKIVPLSHTNILTNIGDIYDCVTIRDDDNILGILPPFHAFGLTASMLLPLCMGMRAVYYPNPNDGGPIGQVIDAYKVSILIGTPTFLYGIVRASNPNKLSSLRLVVSGAEKCPMRTYEALAVSCPNTIVLEGYGVTECSPVISVNHENDAHKGTIGKVMASLEYAIVDQDMKQRVETGREGMLLVRGPSVFDGYMNYQGDSPFVSFESKSWYSTGDLVRENNQGVLTFSGRKKRFIKLGGEIVSLPAIESVLETHYVTANDQGPVLAVTATVGDRPEIVLFSVKNLDRAEVNQRIRDSGLSGIHNIRRVIKLDQLPLLGTGKTDYRALIEQLAGGGD